MLFWPIPFSRSRRELSNGVPNAFGFDRGACFMMVWRSFFLPCLACLACPALPALTLRHRTNKCDRGVSKSIFYKVCSSLVNIQTARNPDRGRSKSSFAKRVFVYKALRSLGLSFTRDRSSANLEPYAAYADRVVPYVR